MDGIHPTGFEVVTGRIFRDYINREFRLVFAYRAKTGEICLQTYSQDSNKPVVAEKGWKGERKDIPTLISTANSRISSKVTSQSGYKCIDDNEQKENIFDNKELRECIERILTPLQARLGDDQLIF